MRTRALDILLPLACVEDGSGVEDEGEWAAAASAIGAVMRHADPSLLSPHMSRVTVTSADLDDAFEDTGSASVRTDPQIDGKICTALALLRYAPGTLAADPSGLLAHVVTTVVSASRHPYYGLRVTAAKACGFALGAVCAGGALAVAVGAAGDAAAVVVPAPGPATRLPLPPAVEDLTFEVAGAYKRTCLPTLQTALLSLLADTSADVRKAAVAATGRVALLGWHGAVGRERGVGAALLGGVLESMKSEGSGSGNYGLRTVSERSLVHWTTAARDKKAASLSSPPGAVLGLLEQEQARTLTDLWRRSLQDAGVALATAGGYTGTAVHDPFSATQQGVPVHVQQVGITASGEDEQEWEEDEDSTLKVVG
jgi:hypothetical protein